MDALLAGGAAAGIWPTVIDRAMSDCIRMVHRNINCGGLNMPDIHPAPIEFSESELATDPILRYFHYAHLPDRLRAASQPFCTLARHIIGTTPRNAERTVALRKLLEAKDAAVRAMLP
jgi:hypothetical protein